jgi:acetylornithine/N-succinyldiaminopimelate aminotransferase
MQEELIKKGQQYIANTYNRYPIVITKGEGCWVWDMNGRRYLDFLAGIAVCNLGHARHDIADAIAAQAKKLMHISNLFHMEPQIKAAEFLVEHSFGEKVFFCNSGAEANEGAIKLARRYSWKKYGPERYEIIVMENSFHGRTLATLTATGQSKFHEGFAPLLAGFSYVPFNDIETLSNRITDRTCAVMLELIQAEGGVYVAERAYVEALRRLADEKDLILIIDEVQTGIGRTGKLFAYEHYGIAPDVMTLAKALGNGFPIGAVVATEKAMQALDPGSHASTFGGNPLAATAMRATLNAMVDEGVVKNCEETGRYLHRKLTALKQKYPFIAEVRGMGLLLGVELTIDADSIQREFMQEGVILNSMKGRILRLVPPLVAKKEEVDIFIDVADRIMGRQKC